MIPTIHTQPLKAERITFDASGTHYDLVLVDDPYGGILVIWTTSGWTGRWVNRRLEKLSGKRNLLPGDVATITWALDRLEGTR